MPRFNLLLAILAAPVFCIPAMAIAAQPQPGYQAGPLPQTDGPSGVGRGDSAMSLADFQARQRTRMMRMDTDGDGRISLAEWTAWRTSHPGRRGGDGGNGGDPAQGFQRIDLNHDGYITPNELDAASTRRFNRMDANHDGVITPDEHGAMQHRGEDEAVQPLPPQ